MYGAPGRRVLADTLLAAATVAVVDAAIGVADGFAHIANISNLLVIAVAVLAASRGMYSAVLASGLAFLTFDWFFVPPLHVLVVDGPGEYLALATLFVTSIVIGRLVTQVRERGQEALARQLAIVQQQQRLAEQEARTAAVEDSDRLKSALVSSVTHELKTPLAAIKAAVGSLVATNGADPLVQRELAESIDRQTDRLTRLVSDLLEVSRLEAGAVHPKLECTAISDVIADVLDRMQEELDGRGVEVSIAEPVAATWLDFTMVSQVLANLLENAAKYAPAGAAICIRAQNMPGEVCVTVSNQGSHLPEADLDRLFEKFYRAAGDVSGSGLGLAIARGLVTALHGRIWAENVGDHGVAFSFTLAAAPEVARAGAACAPAAP